MPFESTFKAIDNTLRHDDGCATALDYVEQSSWILFLKYLDDLEQTREMSALLTGETYTRIIDTDYQCVRFDDFAKFQFIPLTNNFG